MPDPESEGIDSERLLPYLTVSDGELLLERIPIRAGGLDSRQSLRYGDGALVDVPNDERAPFWDAIRVDAGNTSVALAGSQGWFREKPDTEWREAKWPPDERLVTFVGLTHNDGNWLAIGSLLVKHNEHILRGTLAWVSSDGVTWVKIPLPGDSDTVAQVHCICELPDGRPAAFGSEWSESRGTHGAMWIFEDSEWREAREWGINNAQQIHVACARSANDVIVRTDTGFHSSISRRSEHGSWETTVESGFSWFSLIGTQPIYSAVGAPIAIDGGFAARAYGLFPDSRFLLSRDGKRWWPVTVAGEISYAAPSLAWDGSFAVLDRTDTGASLLIIPDIAKLIDQTDPQGATDR